MTSTLVALPGTLCPPSVFDPLAEQLHGEVQVRPVDWLRAPGPWDVPTVAGRVVDDLRAADAPVLLCGHSTGGAVALQVVADAPELVAGLLLVDTGASMTGHGDVDAILTRVRDDWGRPLRAAVLDRSFAVPLPADVRAGMLAWSDEVAQQAVLEVLTSQRDLDLTAALPALAVPTVVVHGEHDRARPLAAAQHLAAGIPGAVLRVVPAGHTPVHEAPEHVAAVVRELVRRVAGG